MLGVETTWSHVWKYFNLNNKLSEIFHFKIAIANLRKHIFLCSQWLQRKCNWYLQLVCQKDNKSICSNVSLAIVLNLSMRCDEFYFYFLFKSTNRRFLSLAIHNLESWGKTIFILFFDDKLDEEGYLIFFIEATSTKS